MFTGIITDIGHISAVEHRGDLRVTIATAYDTAGLAIGASVACSGVCLTVVSKAPGSFSVDVSGETQRRTAAGQWTEGRRLNLERALKVGDELGGHIVTGHVDGIAKVTERRELEGMVRFELDAPRDLARFIATKGSVTLDGVSLTVNSVDDTKFSVLIIPHTLAVTTLNGWRTGGEINLEIDLMARYAARLSEMT
jgi:riboflavin synthase